MTANGLPKEDLYQLLQVEPGASMQEIKDAFKRVALRYHPDKCSDENAVAMFAKCSQAYDVLIDPVSRALYDMVMGVKPESSQERRHINRLKKAEAHKTVVLMEETVEAVRESEAARNGLIIMEAVYGDLRSEKPGSSINVTVPVQVLVENSSLVIQGGHSKAWLEGFYDPCEDAEKELFVRYRFLGKIHEVVVADMEELVVPLKEHVLDPQPDEDAASRTYKERREQSKQIAKTKQRRRWFLYSIVAFVVGLFVARRQGMFENVRVKNFNFVTPGLLRIFGGPETPAEEASSSDGAGNES